MCDQDEFSYVTHSAVHQVMSEQRQQQLILSSLQTDPSQTATTTAASSPHTPAAHCLTVCLRRRKVNTWSVRQRELEHSLVHNDANPTMLTQAICLQGSKKCNPVSKSDKYSDDFHGSRF